MLIFQWLVCGCVHLGPQNNPRYSSDGPRLRQSVDGSADTERDTGSGRQQQQRNGCLTVLNFFYLFNAFSVLNMLVGCHVKKVKGGHTRKERRRGARLPFRSR